ncbi:hypothetical protein ABFS82_13G189100 [Erythranthe guttata]|nr:PREDICTED: protein PHLOEM PROTEIN 2-LIKE A9 [Erythranthe guttata]|eukprot:XP_012829754.1 PREDICTED: protein PHLOEM PROTEIN 2-LIKE A9 [Erythranthe guttata]
MAFSSSPHHLGNPSTNFTKGKMTIPSKDLDIVWGGDDRYWTIPNDMNSAAHLHQVSWLEVTASVRGTNPSKNYDVGFRVSVTPDAFGWSNYPVYIMVKRGKEGKFAWKKFFLNTNETNKPFEITGRLIKAEKPLEDSSDDQRVYFGLYEVWSGKWKGGLKIHHAFITESP